MKSKYSNKRFDRSGTMSSEEIEMIRESFGDVIPPGLAQFKMNFGKLLSPGNQGPYLLLYQTDPKKALAEFHNFTNYEEILHRLRRRTEYSEYAFEVEMKLILIATCEEQVDIYMGYGAENFEQIFIYIWEENEFLKVENLQSLIDAYLVEYDESLFE